MTKFKTNRRFLAISAFAMSLGLSAPASADTIGYSYLELDNFTVSNNATGTQLDASDFSALDIGDSSSASATSTFGAGAISSSPNSLETTQACSGDIACPAIAENDNAQQGVSNFGRGDTFGNGGTIISGLPGPDIVNVWTVAEGRQNTAGFTTAQSGTRNTSEFTFELATDTELRIDFNALAELYVQLDQDLVQTQASYNWNAVIIDVATGATIFRWVPNGQPGNITGGTELSDPFSMNNSRGLVSTGSDGTGLQSGEFAATVTLAGQTTYRLTIGHGSQINTQVEAVIPAQLGDRVWEDRDADGIQDCQDTNGNGIIGDAGDTGPECDAGIPDIVVNLLDGDCQTPLGQQTMTDADGFYLFDLDPGDYCVEFEKPADDFCQAGAPVFTEKNAGGDDAVDSDADTATGVSDPVNLAAGESNLTVDAGLYCPAPGIDIEKLTNGNQADGANDGDVPQIAPGDTVTWTYIVTNTGDVPFDSGDVVVTDDQTTANGVTPVFVPGAGTDDGDNTLSPGEIWHYEASLQAENLMTSNSGVTIVPGCDPDQTGITRPTYENIGTVVAGSETDLDPSHYCNPPEPGIDIEKLTNGNQADGANDTDVPQIAPSDTVTWTYIVTNTGNMAFVQADVIVSDDQPGVVPVFVPGAGTDDGDNFLSPGEVWHYTANLPAENLLSSTSGAKIVPGCDPDNTGLTRPTYENTGTVVAGQNTDFDPSHYCNSPEPGIDIEKLTNGNQADGANDTDVPQIAPSDTVTWTYIVTNTGNVPFALADVMVTDDQPGVTTVFVPASDDGDGILSPGEEWRYTATLPAENLMNSTSGATIVPGCDPGNTGMTRDTYANIGTVVAGTETDEDPSHYCNPPPGIDIEKLTNGNQADGANDNDVPQIAPGETVTWTYIVTNTGGVAFAFDDVVVTDDQSAFTGVVPVFVPGAGTDDGDGFLSPGEVWHYTASLPAEILAITLSGVTIVPGCDPDNTGNTRETYENLGTVVAGTETDSDPSHYCNPPDEVLGCRLTGGLNATYDTGNGVNRYTGGGQVGANTGAQPQPKGEWTHHQQNGPAGDFTFHGGTASAPEGSEIDEIRCSDPGGCGPSGNPPSPVKQLDFDGIGTFKNIGKQGNKVPDFVTAGANVTAEGNGNKDFDGTFHWFEVNIDDLGEPGNTNPKKNPGDADPNLCPAIGFGEKGAPGTENSAVCACSDFHRITIYDGVNAADIVKNPDGSIDPSQLNRTDVIYEVWGPIDGGNYQIHHPTGFDRKQ